MSTTATLPSPSLDLTAATSAVVAGYLARNPMPAEDVPAFVESVSRALAEVGTPGTAPVQISVPTEDPAVPIEESVTENAIFCLECGREMRSLRRHLRDAHGLSPEQYRSRWGLPKDYPMVAPTYSMQRRAILERQTGMPRRGKAA